MFFMALSTPGQNSKLLVGSHGRREERGQENSLQQTVKVLHVCVYVRACSSVFMY